MKIQPMDSKPTVRNDPAKHSGKSRLKRLLERQFPSVLRISSTEKLAGVGDGEVEPSSVCLDRMVLSFIEESTEKPTRSRCNCFNANSDDFSDEESGDQPFSAVDAVEALKGLVPCTSVAERNLLADASKLMERSKNSKSKRESRRIVAEGLKSLNYDASICRSQWEKTPSFPAGEHEYIDVVVDGDLRLLVEVDFRSEFEIARSTKSYRAALQSLPSVFVGTADRLVKIVAVVSEAARQSLKKKGLHFPPWRKSDYMLAKWLSPFQRGAPCLEIPAQEVISAVNFNGNFELRVGDEEERITVTVSPWRPPDVNPKTARVSKVVAGLTALL
ncbi:uncharacterized protein [Typha angustifolia]|uniref:uncharacterized protein n=1 Tax=Typha angustifolia TaxID=59011 RepID=UPI003C2CE89A